MKNCCTVTVVEEEEEVVVVVVVVDTTAGGHPLHHITSHIREAEAGATPDQDHAPTLETVSINIRQNVFLKE